MEPSPARTDAGAVLSLQGVGASPDGTGAPLLHDLDLEVRAGECVALVGPSGSGKTTLLRTLAGQTPPRAGCIRIAGADLPLGDRAARSRSVGLIAQTHDLVDALPVHANVMAGALGRWSNGRALRHLLRPRAEDLREAQAALDRVGLAGKLSAPTRQLSGGERQRVAIARALVQAPALLLADEPVASLDPAAARAVLELLTRLARERGMGLVCSLHQPELAARYFDRVLEIDGGRLRATARAAGPVAARA